MQPVHALVRRERRAADEQRLARLVILLVADGRLQEVLLVQCHDDRLAHLDVVERLGHRVEAERILVAERIPVDQLDVGILAQNRQQVVRRLLDEVDLAGDQRVDGGLLVGDLLPFDAVDLRHLAAGQTRHGLRARLVLVPFHVDGLVARLPFVLLEHERSRSRVVGDLLVRTCRGDALRHHERHVGRRLAEPGQHEPRRRASARS